jgi:hypothetical protein
MTNDEIEESTELMREPKEKASYALMLKTLQMAEWHAQDGDECGVIARSVTNEIEESHPEVFDAYQQANGYLQKHRQKG